jgi:peptidoglycan hydrolase CwlO-like protein
MSDQEKPPKYPYVDWAKLRLIASGWDGLVNITSRHESQITQLEKRMGELEAKLNNVADKVAKLCETQEKMDEGLTELAEIVPRVEESLEKIENDFMELKAILKGEKRPQIKSW